MLSPRTNGVEADDDEMVRAVDGLPLPERALPCGKGRREARVGERNVVVPGNGEKRDFEAANELGCPFELVLLATVCDVACHEQQLWLEIARQRLECRQRRGHVVTPQVEVGNVQKTRGHGRVRLYTRSVANESPEIFDDVYLGLRAGGAVRKQRRGEPLSADEQEAIGRWRRLSLWRKTIAIGAFALGTFGLGLTLGGLIFGRWRRARA